MGSQASLYLGSDMRDQIRSNEDSSWRQLCGLCRALQLYSKMKQELMPSNALRMCTIMCVQLWYAKKKKKKTIAQRQQTENRRPGAQTPTTKVPIFAPPSPGMPTANKHQLQRRRFRAFQNVGTSGCLKMSALSGASRRWRFKTFGCQGRSWSPFHESDPSFG